MCGIGECDHRLDRDAVAAGLVRALRARPRVPGYRSVQIGELPVEEAHRGKTVQRPNKGRVEKLGPGPAFFPAVDVAQWIGRIGSIEPDPCAFVGLGVRPKLEIEHARCPPYRLRNATRGEYALPRIGTAHRDAIER